MLIWYGNVGEETIYFRTRMDNYPVLFWGNLLLNFIAPFFILMRNDTKRKFGTLFFASAIVFFGHWFDFFNMIKPAARETLTHMSHDAGAHGDEEHATMDAAGHGDDHATADDGHDTAGHDDDHAAAAGHDAGHDTAGHDNDHAAADHGDAHDTSIYDNGHVSTRVFLPYKAGYTIPGLLEVGIFLGFLGGFLFFVLSMLTKAPLEPKKDPYFEESLHHHT